MKKHDSIQTAVAAALKKIGNESYPIADYDRSGNIPTVKLINYSLRANGYTITSAVNDIMDNSFDAFVERCTKNPKIHIDYELPVTGNKFTDDHYIIITDNGGGFETLETLKEAMRLGSQSKSNDNGTIGCFGVGLKNSAISLGKLLVIITTTINEFGVVENWTAIMDLDKAEASDSWNFVHIRPSDENEISILEAYENSDTAILIGKLDRVKTKDVKTFKQKIINSAGEVFRYLISEDNGQDGKPVVIINRTTILKPIDPMCRNKELSELLNTDDVATDFVYEFRDAKIKIKWYYVPSFPAEDEDKNLIPSTRNQGMFVLRGNRQIKSRTWLDIIDKHNDWNHCRAELFYDTVDDDVMGTTSDKADIQIPDELVSKLYEDAKRYTKRSKEIWDASVEKKKETEKELSKDDIDKIIEDKINKNPLVPTLITEEFKKKVEKPEPPVPPVDTPEKKRPGRPHTKHQFKNIELVKVDGHERDRFFREIPVGNRKWKLEINVNHPFYKYFKQLNDNGQVMVVNLLYTLILNAYDLFYNKMADIRENDKQSVIDMLFEDWSDDVRQIVNAQNK